MLPTNSLSRIVTFDLCTRETMARALHDVSECFFAVTAAICYSVIAVMRVILHSRCTKFINTLDDNKHTTHVLSHW